MLDSTSSTEDHSRKCAISHSDLEIVLGSAPEVYADSSGLEPLPSRYYTCSTAAYSENSGREVVELVGTKLKLTWREQLRRRRKQLWIAGIVFLAVLATSIVLGVRFSTQSQASSGNKLSATSTSESSPTSSSSSNSEDTPAPSQTADVIGLAAVWDGYQNRTTVIHRSLTGEFTQTDCKLSTRVNHTEPNICNTTELSYIRDARVDTPLAMVGTVGNFTLVYFSSVNNNSIRATNPLTQRSRTVASNLQLHAASKLGVAAADPVADPYAAKSFYLYYQDRDNAIQELLAGERAATTVYHNASEGTHIAAMAWAVGDVGTTLQPGHNIMFLRPEADQVPEMHLVSQRIRQDPRMAYEDRETRDDRVSDPQTALACSMMRNRRTDNMTENVDEFSTICYIPDPNSLEIKQLTDVEEGWLDTYTLGGSLLVNNVTSPMATGFWYTIMDAPPDFVAGWKTHQVLFDTPQKMDAVAAGGSRGYIGQKFYNPTTKWDDGPGIPLD